MSRIQALGLQAQKLGTLGEGETSPWPLLKEVRLKVVHRGSQECTAALGTLTRGIGAPTAQIQAGPKPNLTQVPQLMQFQPPKELAKDNRCRWPS